MNLLTVKNLSVQIERKLIIENLSFELAPGEKLVVLGPNGAGKTIMLRALLRLVPYSGEINWAPDVRIGYVPQKLEADRHLALTYRDLFAAKRKTINVPAKDIAKIGESVGLTKEMLETPVGHLSGGQFQRGLIGFALIGQPNVLLLDEPTASIDEAGEEHIYELISRRCVCCRRPCDQSLLPKPNDSNSDDQSCVGTYRNFGGDTAVHV
jgi:zinc transport system ATP-binding protein